MIIKKIIFKIYHILERCKIYTFTQIFGSQYLINSLRRCWGANISILLRKYGAKIGNTNNFRADINIDNYTYKRYNYFKNLEIGDNCYIGKSLFLDLADKIVIKNDVIIGAKVTILTHQDVGNRKLRKFYKRESKRVFIDDGAWIGANVTILSGVKIGKCAVVAAGSIVTKDVEPYSLVTGVPAKFIKKIDK